MQRVFGDELRRAFTALQVTPQTSAYSLQSAADDLKESPAWQALEAAKLIWKGSLPEQASECFGWLAAMRTSDLLDLVALCVALTLNALPSAAVASEARVLADAVGLGMSDWWPLIWVGVFMHAPWRGGIVFPIALAVALLCGTGRLHRALWINHRYRFATWRWLRVCAVLVLVGAVVKLAVAL